MSTILALDLGKFKTVACLYQSADGTHRFRTVPTTPAAVHDLLVEVQPQRVVIEVGPAAGWVKDLCEALAVPIQVANANTEAWRWKHVKRKTDKDDGLKLARLSAMNQLPTVTLPAAAVRQWRSLIGYRHTLVGRRTAIKNNLRAVLDRQGLTHAAGKSGWTQAAVACLGVVARPLAEVEGEDLWRGQVHVELQALAQVEQLLEQVTNTTSMAMSSYSVSTPLRFFRLWSLAMWGLVLNPSVPGLDCNIMALKSPSRWASSSVIWSSYSR